jgi:hypothetical protein
VKAAGVGKRLRVKVSVLGENKNDVRDREAGGLYILGAAADTWSDTVPGIVEGLPESLQLI